MFAAERIMLSLIFALATANGILIAFKGIELDFGSYSASLIFAMMFVAVGLFYRFARPDPRISTVALAVGFFAIFSLVMSLYSQVLLPHRSPPLDDFFVRVDAALGFSWPEAMAYFAQYPTLTYLLGHVYDLALAFVLLSVLAISVTKGFDAMHELIVSFMIAAIVTILLWSVFPAAGAAAHWPLAAEIDAVVQPRVDTKYSLKLLELYQTGFPAISDISIKGLIGFPSFHTVMYVLPAAYFSVVAYARWPVFALAAFGLVSVAIQGGHHLSDILGGIFCSLVAIIITRRLFRHLGIGRVTFMKVVSPTAPQSTAVAAE